MFERGLAILLSTAWTSNPDKMTSSDYNQLLNSNFSKTFGVLAKLIDGNPEIDQKIIEEIKQALNLRNFLAHRFFWERAGEMEIPQGRIKMINELNNYTSFFDELSLKLLELSISWSNNRGITNDDMQDTLNNIISNAINNTNDID